MQLRKRLLSLALSLVLVLPITLLLSPAPAVSAQTTSTLYGTGSADEINIIKILDMALNKGGMSMSPATIKAFLDFWWKSVQTDLATCIGNADSAITSTQEFANYLYTALESTEHYDKLGSIITRYIQYVLTMEGKSLSDFKQLLLQPGTFRRFLLSYVTDQNGNIAGTVDNKLVKYNIGKEFVNMARQAAQLYIDEYEGYWLMPTLTYKDILVSSYASKEIYDAVVASVRTIPEDGIFAYSAGPQYQRNMFWDLSDLNFVGKIGDTKRFFAVVKSYTDNWTERAPFFVSLPAEGGSVDLSKFNSNSVSGDIGYIYLDFIFNSNSSSVYNKVVFTTDGRIIKVWKSLDAFKASSVGKSNIYYSADYSKYDSSVDNSIEFSGSYYSSNSSSYSHDIIQNTIDNSSEVNESTINNIVNNYITNNNYGDSSGSGSGNGSGESGNDWWNIGDGITSFVKGVAALLDFLLKLLGDLIGVISDFLVGLLEVLKRLGAVGSSFGDFLKVFFGFFPEEIIDLLAVGIGAVVVAGVIKAFKR